MSYLFTLKNLKTKNKNCSSVKKSKNSSKLRRDNINKIYDHYNLFLVLNF